jgi:hypothetical protein
MHKLGKYPYEILENINHSDGFIFDRWYCLCRTKRRTGNKGNVVQALTAGH